jgi:hypothetical protein
MLAMLANLATCRSVRYVARSPGFLACWPTCPTWPQHCLVPPWCAPQSGEFCELSMNDGNRSHALRGIAPPRRAAYRPGTASLRHSALRGQQKLSQGLFWSAGTTLGNGYLISFSAERLALCTERPLPRPKRVPATNSVAQPVAQKRAKYLAGGTHYCGTEGTDKRTRKTRKGIANLHSSALIRIGFRSGAAPDTFGRGPRMKHGLNADAAPSLLCPCGRRTLSVVGTGYEIRPAVTRVKFQMKSARVRLDTPWGSSILS